VRGDSDNPKVSTALCLGAPVEWFFPDFVDEDGNEFLDDGTVWEQYGDTSQFYERGRELCVICPMREDCLQQAMDRRERFGIWGGLIPIERRRIERRDRRKRLQERRRCEVLGLPMDDQDPDDDDTLDDDDQ
jgi:hypothetical protein